MPTRIRIEKPVLPAVKRRLALGLALMLCLNLQGLAGQQVTLLVSAASSLTDILQALKPAAERACGATLFYNFGASGSLRKQIEEGAPADIFFSAASEDVDRLEKTGLILQGSRRDLLSNSLVLVGDKAAQRPTSIQELSSVLSRARLLAIGNPDSVPAGRYAVSALKALGLYDLVQNKLAMAGNVREALQYAETGAAPLAIVFRTDAASIKPASPLGVLFAFPSSSLASPILYPLAVVAATKNRDAALKLVGFFTTAEAGQAFEKAGFVLR